MKTRQRQRLKENDLAATIVRAREYFEPRAKQFGTVAIILGAVVVAIFGISVMQQRANAGGEALLGDAMVALSAPVVPISAEAAPGQVPAAATLGAEGSFSTEAAKLNVALPKLQAAADAFPDSDAGITARYHLAGALAALGRHDEAITAFEEVVLKSGDSLYGRMAQMGKARHRGQGRTPRCRHRVVESIGRYERRDASEGRHPHGTGARLRRTRKPGRSTEDVHADRRRAPPPRRIRPRHALNSTRRRAKALFK